MTGDPVEAALAAIDDANAEDPHLITLAGETGPKELLHGRRATWWLEQLAPTATDAQRLAARAHHFRRWTRPRHAYPTGRAGYLRWRRDAKVAHADEVGEVLARHGVAEATVERVGQIIRKEHLAADPEVRTHEDAVCLVFLESQLEELIDQLGEEHMVDVLAKTLGKMSPAGIAAASNLELDARGTALLDRAARRAAAPADRGASPGR